MHIKEYREMLEMQRVQKIQEQERQSKKEMKNCKTLSYNQQNVPQSKEFMVKLCPINKSTGKRSLVVKQMSMTNFLKELKEYSHIYCDVINKSLKNNLDFDKMCINVNPNVFPYLCEQSQRNQEIIDYINSLRMADKKPINFLFRVGAYEKYGKIFEEYLLHYAEEANKLKSKFGQEELDAKQAEKAARRVARETAQRQREKQMEARRVANVSDTTVAHSVIEQEASNTITEMGE